MPNTTFCASPTSVADSLAAPVPPVAGSASHQDWDIYIGIHCVATIRAHSSDAAARLFIESPSLTARPAGNRCFWYWIYAGDQKVGDWYAFNESRAIKEFVADQDVTARPSPLQLF